MTKTTLAVIVAATLGGCGTVVEDDAASTQAALELEDGGFELDAEDFDAWDDVEADLGLADVGALEADELMSEPIEVDGICGHGFVQGRYVSLRPGMGVARGRVLDADGNVTGHLRAIWGTRRDGSKVFFGKFVRHGRVRGVFRGHADDGRFEAGWIRRNGESGRMRGRYGDPDPDTRGGVFLGRWVRTSCDDDIEPEDELVIE